MISNGVQLEPAFVLHRRPFRNTSLLLDLFTRRFGRVSAVAKGVKRGKSPISRSCQPFVPLLVSWQGRSELKTIIGLEIDRQYSIQMLKEMSLISGLYLNELVLRLCPIGDVNETLYQSYQSTIELLSHTESDAEYEDLSCVTDLGSLEHNEVSDEITRVVKNDIKSGIKRPRTLKVLLRRFELTLLAELGFGLELQFEGITHEPIQEGRYYQYQSGVGFINSSVVSAHDDEAILGEKLVVSGTILMAMSRGDFRCVETCRYAKRLMRSIICLHLGERSLQVRTLLSPKHQAKLEYN